MGEGQGVFLQGIPLCSSSQSLLARAPNASLCPLTVPLHLPCAFRAGSRSSTSKKSTWIPSQPSGASPCTKPAALSPPCCPKCLPLSKRVNPVSTMGPKMQVGAGLGLARLRLCPECLALARPAQCFPRLVLLLLSSLFSLSPSRHFCWCPWVCVLHEKKIFEMTGREYN